MLEKIDLEKKVSKEEYNEQIDALMERLGLVQRQARDAKKPIIILFEGWRGSLRGEIINDMMQGMDARGFDVLSSVGWAEKLHRHQPPFTAFWKNLPYHGAIAVYHRSWYYLKLDQDINDSDSSEHITYEHINDFEKTLTDDNYIILKFFLHISKKQQKENLEKRDKNFGKAWRDFNPAIDDAEDYEEFLNIYDKMLVETDSAYAPWHIIAADDKRSARLDIFTTICETVEQALAEQKVDMPALPTNPLTYDVLSTVNPFQEMSKEEYKEKLDKYQKRLRQLQIEMFQKQIPTIVAFEGWDAGGKGGAIRRLTDALDSLGYCVHPVSAPNIVEKNFHYQWRFWIHMPEPGSIAIFDRTWYGRVMVERVEGFAKDYEWQRAYDEIKKMEAQWAQSGVAIAKFWLQIDKDEQLRRFTERQNDPMKQWKITDEDWRNREKWDVYEAAVNEMLVRTDTPYAPWTIVEGNNKYYARLKVLKTMIDLFEERLK